MGKAKQIFIFLLFGLPLFFGSCKKGHAPKPRGYFRISFPAKEYKSLEMPVPFKFQIPVYSNAGSDSLNLGQKDWVTIEIPANHAQIHLSYKEILNNLGTYIEESRSLAYKHSEKASSIEEQLFINSAKKVYGTVYYIKGNAASPMQFYLTDSVKNFLRGSLYIKEIPNIDSLQPVISFLNQDVIQLIETTEWKENK
jgi:gliding motility-associated lipoprotein GldD